MIREWLQTTSDCSIVMVRKSQAQKDEKHAAERTRASPDPVVAADIVYTESTPPGK